MLNDLSALLAALSRCNDEDLQHLADLPGNIDDSAQSQAAFDVLVGLATIAQVEQQQRQQYQTVRARLADCVAALESPLC